ncbi:MAG: DJ-1/PfpI family protein [Spirochaetales bacterium]|nr:DJ-1/PfpI family protein [Spirochaetales bacterium]
MEKRVLVILADGFEEVEALAPIDVLRRSGASVTVAALQYKNGTSCVRGAHDVLVGCDALLSDVCTDRFDAIVLPGGMPGAKNLHESQTVTKVILDTFKRGDLVCAICASPAFVLAPTGVLEGKRATCYPGCEAVAPNAVFGKERTVRDGNVITGAGPGTALEFGLLISEALFGKDVSSKIHSDMICK